MSETSPARSSTIMVETCGLAWKYIKNKRTDTYSPLCNLHGEVETIHSTGRDDRWPSPRKEQRKMHFLSVTES